MAVKVLASGYAQDERANRRFLREARAGARLSECRHVVTVYDIGEHDGRPFMVMEHFSGGTVADRLRQGRDIPRALALRWLREAADALDCAHAHDVVHRDVKPANLLIDERGRLAVGDFGIATVAAEASLTQTGQVLGTAAYISPEQARGHAATDASDRYALAVVAFELLTGRRPFTADHPAAQARAHVEDRVPSASAAATGLPPRVDRVLAMGMAKDPVQRPATAADFMDDIEDAIDGEIAPAGPPTAVTAPVTPAPAHPTTRSARVTPAPTKRRWPGMAALAALAVVAGAAIAIAAGSGDKGGGGAGTDKHASTPAHSTSEAKSKPKATQAQATTQAPAQTTQAPAQTTQPAATTQGSAGCAGHVRRRCGAQQPGLRPHRPGQRARRRPAAAALGRGLPRPRAQGRRQLRLRALQPRQRPAPQRPPGRRDPLSAGAPADLELQARDRQEGARDGQAAGRAVSPHGRGQDLPRSGEARFIQPTTRMGGGRNATCGRLS